MTSTQRTGKLFVMVGPAGAGKNSLMKDMIARIPGLRQLPTATTRPMRDTEQQGREHVFVTHEEFLRLIDQDALLEHQVVHGRLYGILRQTLEDALDAGELLIADIEIFGAQIVQRSYPDNVCMIFVQPPSIGDLVQRMEARGDSLVERTKRLLRVPMELAYANECDYAILNDDLQKTADTLFNVITAEAQGKRAIGMERIRYDYTYLAQVVPFYHHEVLLPLSGDALGLTFDSSASPAETALTALEQRLGVRASQADLIGGGVDGSFLAPYRFEYESEGAHETLRYIYLYRMEERAEFEGFQWMPARWEVPNGEPA